MSSQEQQSGSWPLPPLALVALCDSSVAVSPTRKSVLSILKSGLDRQSELIALPAEAGIPLHGNVRGPDYYH